MGYISIVYEKILNTICPNFEIENIGDSVRMSIIDLRDSGSRFSLRDVRIDEGCERFLGEYGVDFMSATLDELRDNNVSLH